MRFLLLFLALSGCKAEEPSQVPTTEPRPIITPWLPPPPTEAPVIAANTSLPDKYKVDGEKMPVIYDDGNTRIFWAGWLDPAKDIVHLREMDSQYPTREIQNQISAYEGFIADHLVALRLALFTAMPIHVAGIDLTFDDRVVPNCRVCVISSKDPYKVAQFNIPTRERKPVMVVVLVPEQFYGRHISAMALRSTP